MKIGQKSPKARGMRKESSVGGRITSDRKEPSMVGTHCDRNASEAVKLRHVDKLLTHIERKGEALSASADKLLRRVS